MLRKFKHFSFVDKIKQLFLVSQETSKMQRERDNSCVMNDALKVGTWKRLCLCFLFLLEQTLKETWFYRILSTLGGFITYMHISWYTHGYTYWTLVIVQLLWYFFLKTLTIQVNGCMLIHTMFFSDEDVATFMFTLVFLTKMFCVHTWVLFHGTCLVNGAYIEGT